MYALRVSNLVKRYPEFTLNDINFNIEFGKVVGLVGRNGAGKSTLIKSLLNLIPCEGEVLFSDKKLEEGMKEKIGYVGGGFSFYKQKTVKSVIACVSGFYSNWDQVLCKRLMGRFGLSENKKVCQLSEGMKVKLALTLALSHRADFLIMDEPTSGLDPVSREEFCDIVLDLVKNEGITVLFSTHITSDLVRIADKVAFISDGRVLFYEDMEKLLKKYSVIQFTQKPEHSDLPNVIGLKPIKNGYEGLIEREHLCDGMVATDADIDKIILHLEYEKRRDHD